jgi:hypothetical protein
LRAACARSYDDCAVPTRWWLCLISQNGTPYFLLFWFRCTLTGTIILIPQSQPNMAIAQELDARTLLLQSQMDYTQANDEIIHAVGRTPE